MYTKRNYGFWMTFWWSKNPFFIGLFYSALVSYIFHQVNDHLHIDFSIPWQPISVLGITVAFYLGFKNNASYDRTWEARKIWGSIVNNSRSFGAAVSSFLQGDDEAIQQRKLIYRHIGWLVALRYALRQPKEWEHIEERMPSSIYPEIGDGSVASMKNELLKYMDKQEVDEVLTKSNVAAQILAIQSKDLQLLRDKNYIEDFRHMELHQLIVRFYEDQGKSERIKNFPFPRQYASVALWQTFIFCALIPFGLFDIFSEASQFFKWISIPFSALLIWVFFLMEKIGDYSENPFEGSYNDIPISSISRTIEIDLRQMINDENIPLPIQSDKGFLL